MVPKKRWITAPNERKGPKGTAWVRSFFQIRINARPTKVPKKEPSRRVTKTPGQPRNAPIIANNLMSPPPIPSFPATIWYPSAKSHNSPPPSNKPIQEDHKPGEPVNQEKHNPIPIPG